MRRFALLRLLKNALGGTGRAFYAVDTLLDEGFDKETILDIAKTKAGIQYFCDMLATRRFRTLDGSPPIPMKEAHRMQIRLYLESLRSAAAHDGPARRRTL